MEEMVGGVCMPVPDMPWALHLKLSQTPTEMEQYMLHLHIFITLSSSMLWSLLWLPVCLFVVQLERRDSFWDGRMLQAGIVGAAIV